MRRTVGILLGLVVVFAAIGTVWIYLAGETAPAALTIYELDGDVRLTNAKGELLAPPVGMELGGGDRLRTGIGARAVLALGEETRIRLGPTSSVQVQSVDETGIKLELEDGMLSATVRPGSGGAVRIGNNGREVVAENGVFDVGVDGDAFLAQTTEGSLTVVGTDVARLVEGEQVIALEQHASVGPIPAELLLEVRHPTDMTATTQEKYELHGRSDPGSLIRVAGTDAENVRADAKGVFVAKIPLVEGKPLNVEIEAVDPLGRTTSKPVTLPPRDNTGPGAAGGTDYGNQ